MTLSLLLLLPAGCSADGQLTEWAAGKANDALEIVGGGIQEIINDLHDAEYQGGPFENNPDSAQAYLLEQMREKYGIEFAVAGEGDLENYGPSRQLLYRRQCIGMSGTAIPFTFSRKKPKPRF